MKLFFKISFFLLLINVLNVTAQTYDFRNYNIEDGLPQSQVLSICQENNGNIWFGTNGGGIGKYNGNTFQNYTENDGLANNVVYSVSLMKNGNILLGTNGGLSIYNGTKFINYTEKDGILNPRIYKACEANDGSVWLGTPNGVYILKNDEIVSFSLDTLLNNSSIWTIFIDKSDNIWFGTQQNGVVKFNTTTKKINYYNTTNGLGNNYIWSINSDIQGNIYIGTNEGIKKITANDKIENVKINNQQNFGFYSITPDKQNNIWLTTNNGIYKYNGDSFKRFAIENGLPSNIVLSSLLDREENLWFGTSGCGVSKFSSEAFKSYSSSDNLPGDYIETIFQDSKKNIWLGVSQYGVVKLTNEKTINYHTGKKSTINTIIDDEVQAIAEDNKGNMYLGTINGLSVFDGKKFKNYNLPNNTIYSIIKDSKNKIWIGTKNGLYNFNNGKITQIAFKNLEKLNQAELAIYCIAEDKNNDLWLGTEKGIINYTKNATIIYNDKNGFINKRILSIVKDNFNALWFATDEGIINYDYKSFHKINTNNGLISNKIYAVLADSNNLWIGTNNGVDKLDVFNYHSNKKITIKHYGKEEGFKGLECNANAAYKDSKGNIWFGTIKGVFIFNPNYEKINLKEAVTQITGIRLFFENADSELKKYSDGLNEITRLPNNLILPYDKNHITFDFIGICMTAPTKVQYQFKLEGADNTWYPPTSKTEATYSSLDPGKYTFYLKAMNNDGLWNKNPVTYHFTILPPWWKTWWFYTISVILAFGVIYLFIRVRTKKLKEAKLKLEEEVELRTHELREEKEKVEVVNKEVIKQKSIIETKNQDITDSIKYAKNIQEAMLPPLSNLDEEFKEIFIFYQPKDIVSGDFYWFHKRNNKRLIAAVDCTGHGVPGAFMSIVGNTLLNEIIADKNILEPSKILNELHSGVKEALKQNHSENERRDGMDIALCSLNEENNLLEFAGANRPLWIFRKNKSVEEAFEIIKPNKFAIGGMEMENKRIFTNHSIPVEKGDIVYMFTDGFADQFGGHKGKKFMVGNLQKKVMNIYQLPIEQQKQELQQTFLDWKGDLEQVDDILVIAFKI